MSELTYVHLEHERFGAPLALHRTPLYLRFVVIASRCGRLQWDALDLLDDEPDAKEQVIAAQRRSMDTVHIDRTIKGRRVGTWHHSAWYQVCDPQPPEDVKRDRERWQAWCQAQYEQLKES